MGFFDIFKKKKKMSDGLEKTRTDFFQNIVNTLTSSVIDDDLYNDLEEQLILADVGPSCAVRLVDELRDEVEINGLHTGQEALDALRDIIRREVSPKTDLDLSGKPAVILVVGVNGVGKTTTCGMIIDYLSKQNKGPILVVDADANSNLNEVLGVEVDTTLGDIREEMARAELKGNVIPAGMTKADYAEYRFESACLLYTSDAADD